MKAKTRQYVVDEGGSRMGVILPLGEYEQLLEDLHDLAVVAQRREETAVTFEEMKQRLQELKPSPMSC